MKIFAFLYMGANFELGVERLQKKFDMVKSIKCPRLLQIII